jgi:hypothetical protein
LYFGNWIDDDGGDDGDSATDDDNNAKVQPETQCT